MAIDANTLYIVQHVFGSKFEIQIINVWTLEFRHKINFKVCRSWITSSKCTKGPTNGLRSSRSCDTFGG